MKFTPVFILFSAVAAAAQPIVDRDFRTNPPRVLTVDVVAVPGAPSGQSLLKVHFAEANLPQAIPIHYEGQNIVLRDGVGEDPVRDGVYTAVVRAAASGPTALAAAAPIQTAAALDPEKALLIRHPSVVNSSFTSDPCLSNNPDDAKKKWTFGYLMTQIANQSQTGKTPSELALSWITQWERDKTVNGEVIPPRPSIRSLVIDPWLRASGNNGTLAMHKAPFRLLAIVNRVDLRQNLFFGEGLAGELRFVWGVLDLESRAADGTCQENGSFTVIMEYGVDKRNPTEVKAWGQKWIDLNGRTLNSTAYRNALLAMTESVVKAGAGQPFGRPNGSALIRLRTNEIALDSPWELREFAVAKPTSGAAGFFVPVTTKQTPALVHNNTSLLAKYVNDNEAAILGDRYDVPMDFSHVPFRGGHSLNNIDFWSAPGIRNRNARHLFSLNTCNGCHGAETNTSFLHVFPRPRSAAASLSGFLTGVDVIDPVDGQTPRRFADLARRATDLQRLVTGTAASQLGFQPLARTH